MVLLSNVLGPGPQNQMVDIGDIQTERSLASLLARYIDEAPTPDLTNFRPNEILPVAEVRTTPEEDFFSNPDAALFGSDFFGRGLLGGAGRPPWSLGEEEKRRLAEEEAKKLKDPPKVTDPTDTAGRKKITDFGGGVPDRSHVGPFGAVGDQFGLSAGNFGIDRVDPANIMDLPGDLGRALGLGGKFGSFLGNIVSGLVPGLSAAKTAGSLLGGLFGSGSGYDKGAAIDSSNAAIAAGLATPALYGGQAEFDSWGGIGPANAAEQGAFGLGLGWGTGDAGDAGAGSGVSLGDTGYGSGVAADDADYGIGDLGGWGGGPDGDADGGADAGADADAGGWGGMGDVGDGFGFEEGGWTGLGEDNLLQTDEPAGVVHENEYVIPSGVLEFLMTTGKPVTIQQIMQMVEQGKM